MPTTPFSTLQNALELLLEGSGPPGSELAELIGMPPHDLSAAAATQRLLKADRATADKVWRGIITQARDGDPAWTVIAPAAEALCPKLLYTSRKAGQRHRYRILSIRHRTTDFEEQKVLTPRPPSDGPVTLLATHIRDGVLTPTEAELIARTRLEHTPLTCAARDLRLTYITARRYRKRAQDKVLDSLMRSRTSG
ncbi:hypothetical protein [Nocardiopsis halophila]|uniref:hypothetical protein n=1 Tax=Nocardiopsis halophila TaxID=141692 RepID=UPI00034BEC51|nr:hypothetical protein [Nocardiopsis halophila]